MPNSKLYICMYIFAYMFEHGFRQADSELKFDREKFSGERRQNDKFQGALFVHAAPIKM